MGFLNWAAALAAASSLAISALPVYAETLTVATWGGSYAEAQDEAFFKPFAKTSKTDISIEEYNGGLGQIRSQIEASKVRWNIVDLDAADAVLGCNEGLFEKLDPETLAARKDFIEGAISGCAVGTAVWSTVIAVSTEAFSAKAPVSLRDFFDVTTYPGKRGLRKSPRVALEWALMADGVPAGEIYATLETEEGLDRAFAKLDTIAQHLEWWESGNQPAEWLADNKVVMTAAYSPRAYAAIAEWRAKTKEKNKAAPLSIIWDGQVWTVNYLAIPKGAGGGASAVEFIKFATDAEQQAALVRYLAYGPTRRSALEKVPEEVRGDLPTAPDNMKTALRYDPVWWRAQGNRINRRFSDWLAKASTGARTE